VIFALALETAKLVAIAVLLMRETTVNVTTPLTRVLWGGFLNRDTVLGSFVLGVFLNTPERPLLEFRSVRNSLSNVF